MPAINSVNDFVVKFANVNGSGSASANEMFARSILRMGVPVTSRNIFPSNIQGLPTGGYQFYDSSRPIPPSKFRDDITIVRMPLTEISNAAYKDPRQRQLFKNIIYVGALAQLLGIDPAVLEKLIGEQYRGKDALIAPNHQALRLGHDYARDNLSGLCGLKIEKADEVGNRIFVSGNDAAGLGCVYGGATVAAWYPITPSTSVAEAFAKHCRKYRVDAETGKNKYAIVQSEDEISAIGTVIGAGWNGARAFTATSGPGISLMQEFLGLAYFAEIPAVIIDVQRGGPSTGMPTRTQQADLMICAYASHGDTKHVLLLPEDPRELFEFTAQSFDLAERLQTPVFVLEDLDIGMNDWLCPPFTWDDSKVYDRGKVMTAEELEAGKTFGRYLDVDGDAIPYRTLPGTHPTKGAFFTRGTSRDRFAKYSEEGAVYQDNMQRLLRKFETAKSLVPAPVVERARPEERSKCGLIYFGSSAPAVREAMAALAEGGIQLDTLRLRAFPFSEAVSDFINAYDQVFLVEQNRDAQMRSLLVNECGIDPARFISILHFDGTPITARFIMAAVAERLSLASKEAAE